LFNVLGSNCSPTEAAESKRAVVALGHLAQPDVDTRKLGVDLRGGDLLFGARCESEPTVALLNINVSHVNVAKLAIKLIRGHLPLCLLSERKPVVGATDPTLSHTDTRQLLVNAVGGDVLFNVGTERH